MRTKKRKKKDVYAELEALLQRSIEPGARLYEYAKEELVGGGTDAPAGKPDAKPVKELIAVLQQLRELREGACAGEITVVFAQSEGESWSE